jgi:hypothetical protein
LPYGLLVMGVAATMGVGVWALTGRLAWERNRTQFITLHTAACALFAVGYGLGFYLPDIAAVGLRTALEEFVASPLSGWNRFGKIRAILPPWSR